MTLALHPIVDAEVRKLSANHLESWQERAAILEFDGGHARELAEALALVLLFAELLKTGPVRNS